MSEKFSFPQRTVHETGSGSPLSNASKLKELLFSKELSFIMEAHNGLSAKIVEEEGFKAV
ncbi:hypothetical protein PCO85_08045 [Prodigiosinella aquatilis]|nr:hypothetical protein [Prodigiosinella sp. LS101]WJV55338.1 hypothetical protein PCO85_08045 [Prodigiosinella sp. LS101]WJV59700.1 hypothetical protein PCO84_08050 [Pectobacteriaceae bacterium C111]